jgi:phosphopantetheinyl transferase (holo-ACP synthase)
MQDTKHKVKALDEGNCAAARLGGKEAGVKAMSPRTETSYEAGDADELGSTQQSPGVSITGKAWGCVAKVPVITRGDLSGKRPRAQARD